MHLIKTQPAYILVTTLLAMGLVSAGLIMQSQIFGQQLKAQQELNQATKIERYQILASLQYAQKPRAQFEVDSHAVEVRNQQVLIKIDKHLLVKRPLLNPNIALVAINR